MLFNARIFHGTSPHLRITVTGGVQWMCAGKGIIHAEMPVHTKGQTDPRGLQLWVDLPKKVSKNDPVSKRRLTDVIAVQDGRSIISGTRPRRVSPNTYS